MKKQPKLALRDFYCKKQMDIYVPKLRLATDILETGEGFYGKFGKYYMFPPNRIINLTNKYK